MTKYAILLYSPAPADIAELPAEEADAHTRYEDHIASLGGKVSKAQALQASTMATTVRGDVVSDGPFYDGDQVLTGFFVLEARDLDHALDIAKLCPVTWRGGVEIRPIFTGVK